MKKKYSSFKRINPSKKKISNDNNLNNYISTKKLISNFKITNKESEEKENGVKRSVSDRKIGNLLSKKKNLYEITLNSFRKKNKKNKNEIKKNLEDDEDIKNIHERKKYSQNLIDHINNKVFSKIIATDLLRKIKDKELIEQDFEKEVRNYQLLQILELNNRIRDGEAIKSVYDIKELYDKKVNSNIYNNYFQIKEKEKEKRDLGIRGIKMKSLNLNDINKIKMEKEK